MSENMDSRAKAGYYEYLESEEWKEKRAQRLDIDDNKCKICASEDGLQAHHITYKNVYHEDVHLDLITLCKRCHQRIHQQAEANKDKFQEVILRTAEELRDAIRPIQERYADAQSEILAEILKEYDDEEFRNIQIAAKLIRNQVSIDWSNVSGLMSAMRNGAKQIHSTAIKKAASKRKAEKNK